MKRVLLTLTVVLFPLFTLPQQVVAQQPPEAQRLGWFVGDWTYDHLDGGTKCEWLGDFIVHCQSSWINSAGDSVEVVFLTGYDPEAEVYTAHRFYSGWVDGDTWSFVYEGPAGARYRITMVASEDTWTYEWHTSVKGGPWEPGSTGSATRVR
jgi:hypothetical protein